MDDIQPCTLSDDRKPWDRQIKEPSKWFERFERFRMLGPKRSLRATYNGERADNGDGEKPTVASSWTKNSKKWRWIERADAWDREQVRLNRKRFEEDRLAARDERRQMIRDLHEMIVHQMNKGQPDYRDLKDLVQTAATLFKESRLEFGEPTEHIQTDVIELPSEVVGLLNERGTDLSEFQAHLTRRLREKAQEAILKDIEDKDDD